VRFARWHDGAVTTDDAERQLQEHVRRFSQGVREGDFAEMLAHLRPDRVSDGRITRLEVSFR